MCEIWKDVPGFEGYYQASSFGRIRSVDRITNSRTAYGKILKQSLQNSGYRFVGLAKNGKTKSSLVHRVVAISFLELVDGKTYVNHKDGDKENNNVNNLEWCSFSENIKHSYVLGTRVISDRQINRLKNFNVETKSKSVYQYDISGNLLNKYPSMIVASLKTGVNYSSICSCVKGHIKHKTAGGFVWKNL